MKGDRFYGLPVFTELKQSGLPKAPFWLLVTGRIVGTGKDLGEGRTYPDVVKRRLVGDVIQQEQSWRETDTEEFRASAEVLRSREGT